MKKDYEITLIKGFNPENGKVFTMTEEMFRQLRSTSHPRLLAAVPPRNIIGNHEGEFVRFHRSTDGNTAIKSGINLLQRTVGSNGFKDTDLTDLTTAVLFSPNPAEDTINMLLYAASYLERQKDPKANALFSIAETIERKTSPHFVKTNEQDEWNPMEAINKLIPDLSGHSLSNNKTFGDQNDQIAKQRAAEKVNSALKLINQPFESVVSNIKHSIQENLQVKKNQLKVYTEPEDIMKLTAEITAMAANLEYCDTFISVGADYDNFELTAANLITEIQDEITKAGLAGYGDLEATEINIRETKLQAISSLKNQLQDTRRLRINASNYIYGKSENADTGLLDRAANIKIKRLSQELNENGIPIINIISSDRIGEWIDQAARNKNLDLNSVESLTRLFVEITGYSYPLLGLLEEIRLLDPSLDLDQLGLGQFFALTYSTSALDNEVDKVKGDIMRVLVPVLDKCLDCELRSEHERIMSEEIAHKDITAEDLIDTELIIEQDHLKRELSTDLGTILNFLNIPISERDNFIDLNKDKICKVLLANHELRTYAHDEHLNPKSVLENITDALFHNQPISLQIVRCLRWNYPNRELDIADTTGNYYTFSAEGKPIVRKESVEKAKCEIHNKIVVEPLRYHGVPIKNITLLCTGDFELIGKGYNLDENDPRCVSARAYVEDVQKSIPKWNIYKDIPFEVISFRELIANFGNDSYQTLWDEVRSNYQAVFENPLINYLGYTGKSLERIIDTEHNHRQPFVGWWNRQKSRDFTEHFTTFSIALGAVLSQQEGPKIVTVSGNQYAGRSFAFGHRIHPDTTPLPLTFYKSINDGDQSELYKKISEVVA